MTQTDLADALGLTPSAVGRWENKENRSSEPSGRVLWQLVKNYQLNPDWLFDGVGAPQLEKTLGKEKTTTGNNSIDLIWQIEPVIIPSGLVGKCQEAMKRISDAVADLRETLEHEEQ